jgi:hypothetical protein
MGSANLSIHSKMKGIGCEKRAGDCPSSFFKAVSIMEIVASLLEREILSIVEELDELLGNSEGQM